MSISTTTVMDEVTGLYVPYRGADRGRGPVATYSIAVSDVGDATGGTMAMSLDASFLMFGFHPLLIPQAVTSVDNLATPATVRLSFITQGNERLALGHDSSVLAVAAAGVNTGTFPRDGYRLIIEPRRDVADPTVIQFFWTTNTDTKAYEVDVFFLVYDAEQLAAHGSFNFAQLLV